MVTATAIGSTIQNIARQLSDWRIRPDTVGPIAGATEITIVTKPITRPRECSGTTVRIVVISSGIMSAVPEAWITRATINSSNPGANAATSVPTVNAAIAAM